MLDKFDYQQMCRILEAHNINSPVELEILLARLERDAELSGEDAEFESTPVMHNWFTELMYINHSELQDNFYELSQLEQTAVYTKLALLEVLLQPAAGGSVGE